MNIAQIARAAIFLTFLAWLSSCSTSRVTGDTSSSSRSMRVIAEVSRSGTIPSQVRRVLFRLQQFPLELEMTRSGYSLWFADIPESWRDALAVRGETVGYEGSVFVEDQSGQVRVLREPVEIVLRGT